MPALWSAQAVLDQMVAFCHMAAQLWSLHGDRGRGCAGADQYTISIICPAPKHHKVRNGNRIARHQRGGQRCAAAGLARFSARSPAGPLRAAWVSGQGKQVERAL